MKKGTFIGKAVLCSVMLTMLAACAGGGIPTPPAVIGGEPPSIMDSQPPADGMDQTTNGDLTQAAPGGDTSNLPPASSLGTLTQSQIDAAQNQAQNQALAQSGTQSPAQTPTQGQTTTQGQTQTATYTPPASRAMLTFEPMVGAPKTVARELSTALGMRVAQQSLPVVARNDSKVTHRIKGYFSTNQSGSDCVISYVWDIFDASGKRINRISGTQTTPMVSNDPWDAVTGPVLDKVAVDTAAKLKTWHASI